MTRLHKLFAFAALSLMLDIHGIAAQNPTPQQRDAIRASCRSDFMANCSGVQPGGSDALKCLVEHGDSLSASCKAAVEVVAAPQANPTKAGPATSAAPVLAAPPAVQSHEDQIKAVRQACTLNDLLAHCSWIAPTSPEPTLLESEYGGLVAGMSTRDAVTPLHRHALRHGRTRDALSSLENSGAAAKPTTARRPKAE